MQDSDFKLDLFHLVLYHYIHLKQNDQTVFGGAVDGLT